MQLSNVTKIGTAPQFPSGPGSSPQSRNDADIVIDNSKHLVFE